MFNLQKIVHINGMNITVGESSHVNHRLAQPSLFPVRVSTDIIGAEEGEYLTILDHLQTTTDHEDEVSDALTLADDEVSWSTVSHLEVGGQGSETSITGKSECWVTIEHSPEIVFIRTFMSFFDDIYYFCWWHLKLK